MQVSTVKWLAALCLFTVALSGGLLPFLLKQRSQRKRDRAKALASTNAEPEAPSSSQPRKRRNSLQYEDDDQALQSPVHSGYADPATTRIVVPSAIRVAGVDSAATGLLPSASFLRSESLRTRHPEVLQRRAARKDSTAAPPMDSAASASSAPHRHHSRCCHMDVDRFLSLGNMLGAGIFLGGGLMHLLPEGLLALNDQQQAWEGSSLDWLKNFPIACFLAGIGFFMILVVEEITMAVSARRRTKKEQEIAVAKAKRRDEEEAEAAAETEQRRREREEKKQRNNIAGASAVAVPSTPVSSSSGPRRRRPRHRVGVGAVRSASPSADWKHDLAQNILLGLNPRVMLLPAAPRVRTPKRKPRSIAAPAAAAASSPPIASATTAAASSSPPTKPLVDFAYSSESSLSGSEEDAGPIQQFLDAPHDSAYNSPSPFPTLADPLISRRLSRIHQRGRRGSFPPDDSDSNMLPLLRGRIAVGGAAGGDSSAYSDADSATPVAPSTPTAVGYSASSRAGAATNSAALRSGDSSPRDADTRSAPPLAATSPSPFAVSAPATPTSVASLRQPLLFAKPSDQHLDASPSPPAASYSTFSQSFDPSAPSAASKADGAASSSPPRRGKTLSPHRSARRKRSTDVHHHHHHSADSHSGHAHGHGHDHSAAVPPSHGHGHGHGGSEDGHSHVAIDAGTSYAVAYLLVLALSFHSVFEGIALGTQSVMGTTISIFIAILAHSPLAGFALGVSLVKARASPRMAISCLVLFSSMTPLGCILGLALSYLLSGSTLTSVSACFQSFSAGTFLFVALEEIIPKELASPKDKSVKLSLCLLGFLMMAAIKLVDTD